MTNAICCACEVKIHADETETALSIFRLSEFL